MAGADTISSTEQKVADLTAQIAAYRDLSTSLAPAKQEHQAQAVENADAESWDPSSLNIQHRTQIRVCHTKWQKFGLTNRVFAYFTPSLEIKTSTVRAEVALRHLCPLT